MKYEHTMKKMKEAARPLTLIFEAPRPKTPRAPAASGRFVDVQPLPAGAPEPGAPVPPVIARPYPFANRGRRWHRRPWRRAGGGQRSTDDRGLLPLGSGGGEKSLSYRL